MATPRDCDVILHHRRSMFRNMEEGASEELDQMVETTSPWLAAALVDGSYQGWLVEEKSSGKVIAGGGVIISPWPASPKNCQARRATILNVYTELEFRRQGIARHLMLVMVEWLRSQGFRSVSLHASDAGRHLYESMGFTPTNEMRLRLE